MTIKFKLLLLIIGTFTIATISILITVNKQFITSIDENQHTLYNERIDSILGLLHGYEERLKMTGQVEAYSDGFKESAIDALRKTYYQQQNQSIFPFIINHDKKLVLFPNFFADNLSLTKSELISKTLSSSNKKSGSFEFKERWYLYKRFTSWNWMVVYTVPLKIKYSEVQKLSRILISIMIGIAALAIIIMWLAVIRIIKPIEVLTKGARDIAAGNYSSTIDMTGSDEMSKLAGDFNKMAEAVNKKIVDLNKEISERQQAEIKLNLSNRRYRTLFQHSPIALWEEDVSELYQYLDTLRDKGVKNFRKHSENHPSFLEVCSQKVKIVDVNQEALKMHDAKTKEELLGNLDKIFTEKSLETFREEVIALSKGDLEFESEGEVKTLSGKKKSIFLKMIINREHDDSIRAIITTIDITDRYQMEERLRQAQKMESIGTLAGGIAHDFNNLLYPIIGFSEILKEDLPQDSPEYESAQEIFNAGKRGGELVKQILAFSRQAEHKLSPIRFQRILKEVLKLTRSTIPSDIKIYQDIQKDCGLVMADATQLHQIAMNLITNAYHAVEKTSGEISIQLKEIILDNDDFKDSPLQLGQYVMFSVSDNGVGIPKEIINNIFDPYFTTKEKGKGTGLGLAVVYGILTEHKGDIKVYSEKGKGTTFNVYLPLLKKSSEAGLTEMVLNKLTGTERILLVDDEESVVRLEKQMLERLGYNVTARFDSLEALETFNSNPEGYDLVISDMTMPNMTGDQLAIKLMSIQPDIPIIICTGFSERINKEQAEAIKVKGFLMKPVVKSEMAQMVRKVLDEAKKF